MGDLIHWFASSFIGKLYLGFVIVSATGMVAFLANVLVDRFTTIQKERDAIEVDIKDIPIEDIDIETEEDDFSVAPETDEEDLDYLKNLVIPVTVETEVEKTVEVKEEVQTPQDFTIIDFIDVIENDEGHQNSFTDSDGETPYPRSFNEEDETF